MATFCSKYRTSTLKSLRIFNSFISSFTSPIEVYRRKINDGAIRPDPKQLEVVEKLELLHRNLTSHSLALLNSKTTKKMNLKDQSNVEETNEAFSLNPPKGMYIHGEVGTGKTMLMELLYDSLPVNEKLRTHFHSFMIDILSRIHKETIRPGGQHATSRPHTDYTSSTIVDRIADNLLQSSWVIFLDELQFTDYTSTAVLLNLFQSLFDKGAVVIATSNRLISELGASSVLDEDSINVSELGRLIQRNCDLVCVDSKHDYRSTMMSIEKKYYTPLTSDNLSQISTIFDKLVQGQVVGPIDLDVYGRKVTVPEATPSGICRFNFTDLCCSPLGPADYIKICNTFHTIFLHGIPVLRFHNKNEARRLINFIDAAYESRVKLYCTAESSPEGLLKLIPKVAGTDDPLYDEMLDELAFSIENEIEIDRRRVPLFVTGREEIFAFRRAISRLKEMQSATYALERHRRQYFEPYISTNEDQRNMEAMRRNRLQKRLEEERLKDEGNHDWGEEASWNSWQNDMERKRKQLEDIDTTTGTPIQQQGDRIDRRKRELSPPKFSQLHFWGFGWWENVIKNKKKK